MLGVVFDIAVNAWMGLHIVLVLCGLILIILNLIGDRIFFGKLSFGKAIGKNIMSLIVLALTALFIFGFFSCGGLVAAKDDTNSIIREAEKAHEKGGADKALAYLEKAVEGRDWDKNTAFLMAELHEEAGRYAEAKDQLDDIFYNIPLNLEARYMYAGILLKEKNHTPALEQLLYIVRINPSHADAYSMLGEAYWDMGDHIRGIYYHKLAVNEAPASIEKRMKLAQAYADMHSYQDADIEYKKALEMASGFEEELMVYNGYDKMTAEMAQESQAK